MSESFCRDTKSDLCAERVKRDCCRKSLLYGMLYTCDVFSYDEIRFSSENTDVFELLRKLLPTPADEVSDASTIKKISYISRDSAEKITRYIGIMTDFETPDRSVFECESCEKMFLRGAFLSCGTISSPGRSYHLEFAMSGQKRAVMMLALLEDMGLPAKLVCRSGRESFGVYYKESSALEDFLGVIGAQNAAFELMNAKIYKDLRNNANRVANCEAANIDKTVSAATGQMNAILKIIESGAEGMLSDDLRQTLDLRAANPDATLSELAAMHDPKLTKSGVNHRLKRIEDFAKSISRKV